MAIPLPTPYTLNQCMRFQVRGISFGQKVYNTFDYVVTSPPVPGPTAPLTPDFINALRLVWRINVLPLLTTDYDVVSYWGGRISTVRRVGTLNRIEFTYTDQYLLPGVIATDSGSAAPPSATLFDTVTVRKLCVPANRNTRGANRYSPIAALNLTADGQRWLPATLVAWRGAETAMAGPISPPALALQLTGIVFSGAQATIAPFPLPGQIWVAPGGLAAFAVPISFLPMEKVRSQISRKPNNVGY